MNLSITATINGHDYWLNLGRTPVVTEESTPTEISKVTITGGQFEKAETEYESEYQGTAFGFTSSHESSHEII